MKKTDSQGLPYPEGEDFGLGSLDLQVLAEAVNTKLVADHARYDSILASQALVGTLVSDYLITANQIYPILFDTTLYKSNPIWDAISPFFSMVGWVPGIYQTGMYIHSNPVGTVTVDTFRTIRLQLIDYRGPGAADRYTEGWQLDNVESNTGGEFQTMHATFEMHSPERASLVASFSHNNSGSSVHVKAASYWWVTRIGDFA